MPNYTLTLQDIRDHQPYKGVWGKLLQGSAPQSNKLYSDIYIDLETVLKSVGVSDAIWILRCVPEIPTEAFIDLAKRLIHPGAEFLARAEEIDVETAVPRLLQGGYPLSPDTINLVSYITNRRNRLSDLFLTKAHPGLNPPAQQLSALLQALLALPLYHKNKSFANSIHNAHIQMILSKKITEGPYLDIPGPTGIELAKAVDADQSRIFSEWLALPIAGEYWERG